MASDGLYPASSQGYIDAVTGQDGNLYCAFYDDRTFPGNPNHRAVYVRKSVDGGLTWGNIDLGATGFALGLSRRCWRRIGTVVEVFQTTPGNYRIAVAVYAGNAGWNNFAAIVFGKIWAVRMTGHPFMSNTNLGLCSAEDHSNSSSGQPSRTRLVMSYVSLDFILGYLRIKILGYRCDIIRCQRVLYLRRIWHGNSGRRILC